MIVAGFGFRTSASAGSLLDAFEQAVGEAEPTHLSAPGDKVDAPCLRDVAARLRLPVVAVEAFVEVETVTQSAKVLAERGVGSVAEAVALVAAGEGAHLLAPRTISADRLATCAIAVGAGGSGGAP